MTSTCTIFGPGNSEQEIEIEYYFQSCGLWFSPSKFEVTELIIHSDIKISPSDLREDLQVGIALALYVSVDKVIINCEPEVKEKGNRTLSKFRMMEKSEFLFV